MIRGDHKNSLSALTKNEVIYTGNECGGTQESYCNTFSSKHISGN